MTVQLAGNFGVGIPQPIQPASLTATLKVIDAALRAQFGIAQPRILVSGLNPHSGESGHLGREEIEVIGPVIAELSLVLRKAKPSIGSKRRASLPFNVSPKSEKCS